MLFSQEPLLEKLLHMQYWRLTSTRLTFHATVHRRIFLRVPGVLDEACKCSYFHWKHVTSASFGQLWNAKRFSTYAVNFASITSVTKSNGGYTLTKTFRHHLSCNNILRILFSMFTDPCPAWEYWGSRSAGNYLKRKNISITELPSTWQPVVQTKTERFIKPYLQS